jgi:hypothetical protein
MSLTTFVLLLCTGAALLALWLVVRFPDFGPDDMTKALLHVAISMVVLQLLVPGIHLVRGSDLPGAEFAASFGIVLPGLTYVFLSAAWLIRATGSRLRGGW